MSAPLSPDARRALANRIRFYQEMGIYDFYRREGAPAVDLEPVRARSESSEISTQPEQREEMSPRKSAAAVSAPPDENIFELLTSLPETADRIDLQH